MSATEIKIGRNTETEQLAKAICRYAINDKRINPQADATTVWLNTLCFVSGFIHSKGLNMTTQIETLQAFKLELDKQSQIIIPP